nr:AI-2E family transporter [Schlegelella koreensis]
MASAALLWVIWPYVGAIFWSIVLAVVFAPLYRWLLRASGGRRGVAGASTLLIVAVAAGIPTMLLVLALLRQARALYADIVARRVDIGAYVGRIVDALPPAARQALESAGLDDLASLRDKLAANAVEASQYVATHLLGIGLNVFAFALGFAIMLYLFYVLLTDGGRLAAQVERFSPLEPDELGALARTFATVIRATVKGGVVMAATQGALGGVVLGALGIAAPLFWGVLFGLLSMIPAVGAGLLWAPIALYFLVTGAWWKGLGLVFFGVVVLTAVDNILRPILVGRDTHLPGSMILVTTLGGIASFGVSGVVIGPVVAAMFVAIWQLHGAGSEARR